VCLPRYHLKCLYDTTAEQFPSCSSFFFDISYTLVF
jgi:hypothetical protein